MAVRKTALQVHKKKEPLIVLSIAGHDPSSGAGITADIKTIAAHGCYGLTCITALTVQSTRGVKRVIPVSAKAVALTLEELAADFEISAVKIGMLSSAEVAGAVARFLRTRKLKQVVLDPVLLSSSGSRLLSSEGVRILKKELMPLVDVITPNTEEASALSGVPREDARFLQSAAKKLHRLGVPNIAITGGHLDPPTDFLSGDFGKCSYVFRGKKIVSNSTHGTGCAYSSALACNLAAGCTLRQAASAAQKFVVRALQSAPGIGKGSGPVV